MQGTWMRFPNGKVWRPNPDTGLISGRVWVPGLAEADDMHESLDLISEAVTGSAGSLSDFTYEYVGKGYAIFEGCVNLDPEDGSAAPVELAVGSRDLRAALQAQYGLTDVEITHALLNRDNDYGRECVLSARESGRELRCPAFPMECSYVRVVLDGLELAYWIEDEWRDDPAEVMGAIFGAARAGV